MIKLICDLCGKVLWESGTPTVRVIGGIHHAESGVCVCKECVKANIEPLQGRKVKMPAIRFEKEDA